MPKTAEACTRDPVNVAEVLEKLVCFISVFRTLNAAIVEWIERLLVAALRRRGHQEEMAQTPRSRPLNL